MPTKYPGLSKSTQAAVGPAKMLNAQPPLALWIARGRWAEVGWEFWEDFLRGTDNERPCALSGLKPFYFLTEVYMWLQPTWVIGYLHRGKAVKVIFLMTL